VLTTACSGPQTQHHLASILADHYKTEDINFAVDLAEP
jgi:translation initiation factor eIF-2B subunit beta